MRGSAHWILAVAALAVLSPAAALRAGSERGLAVGHVIWQGYPDGMLPSHAPSDLALSPDGAAFVFFQGPPVERAMLLEARRPGARPKPLAPLRPFAGRAPRFARDGSAVLFTAMDDVRGPGNPPRCRVARVTLPALEVDFPGDDSAVALTFLLDAHPSLPRILVGVATEASGPEFDSRLEVGEIEIGWPGTKGIRVSLGFRISVNAEARYARDGRSVEYTIPSADRTPEETSPLYAFELGSGEHRLLRPAGFDARDRAGGLDVSSFTLPHLGSVGWDAFATRAVWLPGARCAVPLRFPDEVLLASGRPPIPISFRDHAVLLCGGPEDRPLPMVAAWAAPATEVAASLPCAATSQSEALLFDPAATSRAILARRDLSVEPLILRLAMSLRDTRGRGDSGGRVEGSGSDAGVTADLVEDEAVEAGGRRLRISVIERVPGHLRVERRLASDPDGTEGRDEARDRSGTTTVQEAELVLFDGKTCWMKSADDVWSEMPPTQLLPWIGAYSPFRVFLDPAHLGDTMLRFDDAVPTPPEEEEGGRRTWKVRFSYADGFRGELVLAEDGGRLLPAAVRAPLVVRTAGLRRALGSTTGQTSVTFGDWRPALGRWIPHAIELEDGATRRRIRLLSMGWRGDVTDADFREPGRGR